MVPLGIACHRHDMAVLLWHDPQRQERPLLRRAHLHRGRPEPGRRRHPEEGRQRLELRPRRARQGLARRSSIATPAATSRPSTSTTSSSPSPPPPYPPAWPSCSSPSSTSPRARPPTPKPSTPSSRTPTPKAPAGYSPPKSSTPPPPPRAHRSSNSLLCISNLVVFRMQPQCVGMVADHGLFQDRRCL